MLTEDLALVVTTRSAELRALAPQRRIPGPAGSSLRSRAGRILVRAGLRLLPAQERRTLAAR